MNKLHDKLVRFMYGRYGVDQYNRFLFGSVMVLILVNLFARSSILYYFELFLILYGYFRMFSKNHAKRYSENVRYLGLKNQIVGKIRHNRQFMEERKTNHIYSCPSCQQKIRVPRGKGKVEITCPKCRTKFVKRS